MQEFMKSLARPLLWVLGILIVFLGILLHDILFLLLGVFFFFLMPHRNRKGVLFFCVTFFLFFLMLEAGFRIFHPMKNGRNPTHSKHMTLESDLGWITEANHTTQEWIDGYGEILHSTGPHGFRCFGDVESKKTKILVLGDSYTDAETVSDGYTYYDYLRSHGAHLEIFAYGCGHYGTLQEYMILDRFLHVIRPDMVLWQFCGNDIINNSHELESSLIATEHLMIRPYYREGRIEYRYTQNHSPTLRIILQHSRLLRLLVFRWDVLKIWFLSNLNRTLFPEKLQKKYDRAIQTTTEILYRATRLDPDLTIVAFSTRHSLHGIKNIWPQICEGTSIQYITGVPDRIQEAKDAGVRVDGSPHDTHWNASAHEIAGKAILQHLVENNLL